MLVNGHVAKRHLFLQETMSSLLDQLVTLFDGKNYHIWSVQMQAFLQMLELWEVTGGNERMPREPLATRRTTGTGVNATTTIIPVPAAEMAHYHAAYDAWNKADNKADGALTLRLAPHLWQYRRFTARSTWLKLAAVFGEKSPAKWDNEAQLEEQHPSPSSVLQQPGQQPQQQQTAPKKRQGGHQEREKQERRACKKQQPHPISHCATREVGKNNPGLHQKYVRNLRIFDVIYNYIWRN